MSRHCIGGWSYFQAKRATRHGGPDRPVSCPLGRRDVPRQCLLANKSNEAISGFTWDGRCHAIPHGRHTLVRENEITFDVPLTQSYSFEPLIYAITDGQPVN